MTLDTLRFTVLLERGITFGLFYLIAALSSSLLCARCVVRCALRVLGNLLLGKSKRMRERNELADAARGAGIRSTSRNRARN